MLLSTQEPILPIDENETLRTPDVQGNLVFLGRLFVLRTPVVTDRTASCIHRWAHPWV